MHVQLQQAHEENAATLAQLLELYCHDLSVLFALRLGADGRYGYPKLPLYWQEPEQRSAYFILAGGELAGFALVTRGSPATEDPTHLDVTEFFVVRRLRAAGVGRQAAHALWAQRPGHWIVRAAASNRPAVAFWRRTVLDYAGGAAREERRELQGRPWFVFELDAVSARHSD